MAEDISNSLKIEEDSEGTSAVECPTVASSSSHSSSPSCDLQRKTSSTASQQEKRSKSSSSARSSSSGSGGSSSYSVRKTRPNTAVLIQWILDNSRHPYPTKLEKEDLARRAWMNLRQLNDWFANVRRNIKKKGFDKWKRRHTASTASLCFLSNEDPLAKLGRPPNLSYHQYGSYSPFIPSPSTAYYSPGGGGGGGGAGTAGASPLGVVSSPSPHLQQQHQQQQQQQQHQQHHQQQSPGSNRVGSPLYNSIGVGLNHHHHHPQQQQHGAMVPQPEVRAAVPPSFLGAAASYSSAYGASGLGGGSYYSPSTLKPLSTGQDTTGLAGTSGSIFSPTLSVGGAGGIFSPTLSVGAGGLGPTGLVSGGVSVGSQQRLYCTSTMPLKYQLSASQDSGGSAGLGLGQFYHTPAVTAVVGGNTSGSIIGGGSGSSMPPPLQRTSYHLYLPQYNAYHHHHHHRMTSLYTSTQQPSPSQLSTGSSIYSDSPSPLLLRGSQHQKLDFSPLMSVGESGSAVSNGGITQSMKEEDISWSPVIVGQNHHQQQHQEGGEESDQSPHIVCYRYISDLQQPVGEEQGIWARSDDSSSSNMAPSGGGCCVASNDSSNGSCSKRWGGGGEEMAAGQRSEVIMGGGEGDVSIKEEYFDPPNGTVSSRELDTLNSPASQREQ